MKQNASLSVIAAACLWGLMSLFVRNLNALGFETLQIVSIRCIFSSLLILAGLLIKDRSLLKVKPAHLWVFGGTGLVSMVFFNWCYFTAIRLADAGAAAVLLYTSPIWVMLFSAVLFGEKITRHKLAALAATFLGCVLVSGKLGGQGLSLYVILVGVGSGIGYGLYSIFGTIALQKGYSSLTITAYTFFFAAAGTMLLTPPQTTLTLAFASSRAFLFCVGIAVAATLLPYLLYTWGLSKMEPGRAAILATCEPLVAAVVGIAVWGESLTLGKAAGVALIFAAVALLNTKKE